VSCGVRFKITVKTNSLTQAFYLNFSIPFGLQMKNLPIEGKARGRRKTHGDIKHWVSVIKNQRSV
jgi:hypothetical protein